MRPMPLTESEYYRFAVFIIVLFTLFLHTSPAAPSFPVASQALAMPVASMGAFGNGNGEKVNLRRIIFELFRAYCVIGRKWEPAFTGFGSARIPEGKPDYEAAVEAGAVVQELGGTVRTGAGPSIMAAFIKGFVLARISKGIKAPLAQGVRMFFEREPLTPFLSGERYYEFRHFAVRKIGLILNSRIVIFKGGWGTLDELFEAWWRKLPIVLVDATGPFWSRLLDVLEKQWNIEGLLHGIDMPQVSTSPRDAITYLNRQELPAHPASFLKAAIELLKGLKWISQRAEAVTVFVGAPGQDDDLKRAVGVAASLMAKGHTVRIMSRDLFSAVAALPDARKYMQAVLYVPENEEPTAAEREFPNVFIVRNATVQSILMTKHMAGLYATAGRPRELSLIFDPLVIMQCGKFREVPLILGNPRFFKPIWETLSELMLKNDIPLISDADLQRATLTDNHAVAVEALENGIARRLRFRWERRAA